MFSHYIIFLIIVNNSIICRDFYAGMFKRNDFLVAQDRLYKEKVPHRYMYARYGRHFKCPITYLRVVDRLGVGKGPQVQVVRGGIRYNNVVLRLRSPYSLPISVNIYVGCENKMQLTTPVVATVGNDSIITEKVNTTGGTEANNTNNGAPVAAGNETQAANTTGR